MTTKLNNLFVFQHEDIHAAIEKLDVNEAHIVLVINEKRQLIGTVTDGDVRRGMLKGISLGESVKHIMNPQPIVAKLGDDRDFIFGLMRSKQIRQIPVVDEHNIVHEVEILDDFRQVNAKNNTVVLMAGGLSTRLRPLTNDCPKPMLKIGGKPILETILLRLVDYGFHNIYISINYLGDQIQHYFKDGAAWGVNIQYLRESEKLGTAGALGMLPTTLNDPIIVMNSDLLTKVDFNKLLAFHHEQNQSVTIGVREYDYTVPYGICQLEENNVVKIKEKPTYKFFINAGVYVIDPLMLQNVVKGVALDMPAFINHLLHLKHKVGAFPIREYWLDIGQPADFEKAHQDYHHIFMDQEI